MVIQVRFGVFETNSSSTHSLVICSDEELDLWKEGKLVYTWSDNLIPSTNEEGEEGENFSKFCEYLEVDSHTYITKDGEKINIICRYGYDY